MSTRVKWILLALAAAFIGIAAALIFHESLVGAIVAVAIAGALAVATMNGRREE